jgi:methanol corrinoid protein
MGKAMEKKGVIITHTAEGDIHDLGQKIVNALLRANGYEVIDLGKDVPVDDVVAAVKQYKPAMLTGTALMTTTMTAFERISKRLTREGINVPFVCGGGAVSEEYVTSFDLGIWGKDASQAPLMAADAVSGKDWRQLREKWNG